MKQRKLRAPQLWVAQEDDSYRQATVEEVRQWLVERDAFDYEAGARLVYDGFQFSETNWVAGWWGLHSRIDKAINDVAQNFIKPIVMFAMGYGDDDER